MAKDYEVGYGKPPVEYRWKKGRPSPNPGGRPKGSRTVSTVLAKELLAPTAILDGPDRKRIKVPLMAAFIRKLMADYGKGSAPAAKILAELIQHVSKHLPAPDNDNYGDGRETDPGDEAIIEAALALRHIKGGGDE